MNVPLGTFDFPWGVERSSDGGRKPRRKARSQIFFWRIGRRPIAKKAGRMVATATIARPTKETICLSCKTSIPGEKQKSELTVIVKAKDLCKYVMTVTQKSPKQFRFTFTGWPCTCA